MKKSSDMASSWTAYRFEQAREVAHQMIQGDAMDVHCPVESLSLLYLNPP
jgi:hypothetical protein